MSSDDEDYMSDKFLSNVNDNNSPGLIKKYANKRQHEILKRKIDNDLKMKEVYKSKRLMEIEEREKGLSAALPSNNKGFEMLMRMGYKPGKGVGKDESGRSEPISIDLKTNRSGLGKDKPKVSGKKCENSLRNLDNLNTNDFRSRIALERIEKLFQSDLIKSQKICQQLDSSANLKEPEKIWFWLREEKNNEKEGDDDDDDGKRKTELEKELERELEKEEAEEEDGNDLAISEKMKIITEYLRGKYFYCIWCGTSFDDERDINENCPGNSRNDH